MNDFSLDLPINNLSFGNVAVGILRECYRRGLQPNVFPMAGTCDLSAQQPDAAFNSWLGHCINKAQRETCRKTTAIKLWHLNGSLSSYSETDARLLTFHELDQLTPTEVNILRNQDRVYVTSRFTQQVFASYGVESEYLPLGFDAHNFHSLPQRPKIHGVTQWGVGGKAEKRKGHDKIIRLWAKRYGNNPAHHLNLAIYNPFLTRTSAEEAAANTHRFVMEALEGKQYANIGPKQPNGHQFLPHMASNAAYNQFLQINDIFFALSGGEGKGLPEYHATALGAWPIALRAHSYIDFLNDTNAIMVDPTGKRPAADGVFFAPAGSGGQFNEGNFFDFSEEAFYKACDEAEKRAATGINTAGLALQQLGYAQTVDVLLKDLK
jgi:hypothetical protein